MTKKPGFSLIELSIYIAIVGILMIIAIPYGARKLNEARKSKTETALLLFETEIEHYTHEVGQYPKVLEDLIRKPADKEAASRWGGEPFIDPRKVSLDSEGKILDGWGTPFHYQLNAKGTKPPYKLYSEGNPKADEPTPIDVWTIRAK